MFEEGIAAAASGPPQPVLVSIFLPGGVDGLSLLAPVGDPRYRTLRPKLGLGDSEGTPPTPTTTFPFRHTRSAPAESRWPKA